ncbi:MAG: hypothetical protein Q4F65_12485 [Propionibacteriaceae bacterium]|nr:hypothetical protein [Propionibacteriaceae bacterium]
MKVPHLVLAVGVVATLSLAACATSTPEPTPTAPPSSATTTAWPTPTPAKLNPGSDGKVEGMYGKRLRLVPADPAASFECRPPNQAERDILKMRGNRLDRPAPPAAVDLPEGWALIASWGSHAGVDPYRTALLTDGATFQELPLNGSWLGTHTNAGIAFEDGPTALTAALDCLDR